MSLAILRNMSISLDDGFRRAAGAAAVSAGLSSVSEEEEVAAGVAGVAAAEKELKVTAG